MNTVRVACLQMQSGNDLAHNLDTLRTMMRDAAAGRAKLVMSIEYVLMMDGSGRTVRERALSRDGALVLGELQALARELRIWMFVGSLTLRADDERMVNRSYLVDASGAVVAA